MSKRSRDLAKQKRAKARANGRNALRRADYLKMVKGGQAGPRHLAKQKGVYVPKGPERRGLGGVDATLPRVTEESKPAYERPAFDLYPVPHTYPSRDDGLYSRPRPEMGFTPRVGTWPNDDDVRYNAHY